MVVVVEEEKPRMNVVPLDATVLMDHRVLTTVALVDVRKNIVHTASTSNTVHIAVPAVHRRP